MLNEHPQKRDIKYMTKEEKEIREERIGLKYDYL